MSFQLTGRGPEIYETVMVPLWFGRWAEALLDLVAPAPGERILDLACGTGITTRSLRDRVGPTGRVTGLDINAGMLAQARTLAPGSDIDWLESDVAEISLADASFDAVISQHGLHYFPEPAAALGEIRRLLVPGGRTAHSIWVGHSPYTEALCRALEPHLSPETVAKQRSQRETPAPDVLSALLDAAGFREIAVHRQELEIDVPEPAEFVPLHIASMPIAGAVAALPYAARAAIADEVTSRLADRIRNGRLRYPDAVNVVTGRR
ncbi:class I SAM-dependent methyltransferase [Jannaschia seohaensis]|uniref:Ubiquinone/menaquinone biosynthesis C-methylase UbiE n=1 Tax=Jannaschia seohaensis TaxID=475081 RepID=A0A2Y9A7N1_9RHOB|nr:methyltransferase domain-containing protein [Jannaschia seohaensis]PWJ22271.1 ubiquinone/menaquinone biosynthesis C-methylase UbiE [Jannaschia seohaensis]SSA38549.1 Ubiquinone/menaquinone biosynthesis C-methylase UbiE [Jannaschia seohaensis]